MRTENSTADNNRSKSLDLVLGLLPLLLGLQLIIWIAYLPSAMMGNADFRNCYSSAVLMMSGAGHQLYDYEAQKRVQDQLISGYPIPMPYVHPSYEVLLFAPLAFLSYKNAFLSWLGVNLIFLLICHRMLTNRLWRLHGIWHWFPFLFLIGFPPITAALIQGQDSMLTLMLFAFALIALESGKNFTAGILVGLASYKFQLILPIVCLFLLWRNWRFILGTCSSAFATVAGSAFVSGIRSLLSYPRYVQETSVKFAALMPVGGMPNLRGLISLFRVSANASLAAVLLVSIATMVIAAWGGQKASPAKQFAIAVTTAGLVGYHLMMHDLSIMLIPMALILDDATTLGLWSTSLFWLSTALSFFRSPIVAVPLLGLLVFQVQKSRCDRGTEHWVSGDPIDECASRCATQASR
jgi:hypothetical protein